MIEVFIYTLADPETNEIRYVGKTKKHFRADCPNISQRLKN